MYLKHHGVKGMKWGVRRYQPYGEGGYTPKQKKNSKPLGLDEIKQMKGKVDNKTYESMLDDYNKRTKKEIEGLKKKIGFKESVEKLDRAKINNKPLELDEIMKMKGKVDTKTYESMLDDYNKRSRKEIEGLKKKIGFKESVEKLDRAKINKGKEKVKQISFSWDFLNDKLVIKER